MKKQNKFSRVLPSYTYLKNIVSVGIGKLFYKT